MFKLFHILLFIISINAFQINSPNFIQLNNLKKPLNDCSCLLLRNGNKTLDNLEIVYYSKFSKIAFFKYKDDIDIVTENITDYYRRLYNASLAKNI